MKYPKLPRTYRYYRKAGVTPMDCITHALKLVAEYGPHRKLYVYVGTQREMAEIVSGTAFGGVKFNPAPSSVDLLAITFGTTNLRYCDAVPSGEFWISEHPDLKLETLEAPY